MPITHFQFQEMLARVTRNKKRDVPDEPKVSRAVEREGELHQQIKDYCNRQFPKWKFIHSRMDKRPTIGDGIHDITIFASGERTYCIECKAKNHKLDKAQQIWRKEMEMVGHVVHTVWSFDEFLDKIKEA